PCATMSVISSCPSCPSGPARSPATAAILTNHAPGRYSARPGSGTAGALQTTLQNPVAFDVKGVYPVNPSGGAQRPLGADATTKNPAIRRGPGVAPGCWSEGDLQARQQGVALVLATDGPVGAHIHIVQGHLDQGVEVPVHAEGDAVGLLPRHADGRGVGDVECIEPGEQLPGAAGAGGLDAVERGDIGLVAAALPGKYPAGLEVIAVRLDGGADAIHIDLAVEVFLQRMERPEVSGGLQV